jgi:hypothetical protein
VWLFSAETLALVSALVEARLEGRYPTGIDGVYNERLPVTNPLRDGLHRVDGPLRYKCKKPRPDPNGSAQPILSTRLVHDG